MSKTPQNAYDKKNLLKGKIIPNFCRMSMWCIVIINIVIILPLLQETILFFQQYSFLDFIFGTTWSPNSMIPKFSILPLICGTLLISALSILISLILALPTAIYLSEYAHKKIATYINPILNILGSVPTIVYGFLAIIMINPAIQSMAQTYNISIATESALTAAIAMSCMIMPIILSLSYTALNSVPVSLYLASYGLGANKEETIIHVILPYIKMHIFSAILLSLSRALGETMIVVMCAGVMANFTFNPLQSVTTITVQIVTLFTGDANFNSIDTLAGFTLGTVLFVTTFVFNGLTLFLLRRCR